MTSLKTSLDRANPNTLADHFRAIKIGQTLASDLKQTVRKYDMATAGVDPYNLATLDCLKLPDDAKAIAITRAYARAGAGTLGELAPQAFAATPIDGQIAVSPSGDIVTLTLAVAYTSIDVEYWVARGDVVELTLTHAASVVTPPAWVTDRGIIMLLEAEALVGGLTGKMMVLKEGAAPATTYANLSLGRATVLFAAADAVTKSRIKLLIVPTVELKETLDADSELL